mgnify:CR=1 FL=1
MIDDLPNILESLLFVSDEPISPDRLKKIIPEAEDRQISEALDQLARHYDDRRSGIYLEMVAGGYQLRTRPQYTEWIRRLVQPKPVRLSKASLETLAIVAYKQPVIRADIEHIRGVDCGGVLRMLLERRLIRVLGRKEIPGRPLIYATTRLFLEIFGLKDLKDLPSPKEIEALEEAGGADEIEADDDISREDALFAETGEAPETHPTPAEDQSPSETEPDRSDPPPQQPEAADQVAEPETQKGLDDAAPSDYTENPDAGG